MFASGTIIYAYVNGNPVNAVDPLGLHPYGRGKPIIGEIIEWISPPYLRTPIPTNPPKSDDAATVEAEKNKAHEKYHEICDRPPPIELLTKPCELARWQYKQAKFCYDKRAEWEDRWGNEASKEKHARQLEQVKRRMANAASDIAKYCGEQQCPE